MDNQNLRHQLDAPMRKVREELGLRPLDDAFSGSEAQDEQVKRILGLFKCGIINIDEARGYFDGISRPGAVIEHPIKLTKEVEERIKSTWKDRFMGTVNAHRPITLTNSTGPR